MYAEWLKVAALRDRAKTFAQKVGEPILFGVEETSGSFSIELEIGDDHYRYRGAATLSECVDVLNQDLDGWVAEFAAKEAA